MNGLSSTTMRLGPVVDTGPLVNLLVLHYVRIANIPEPRRNALLSDASNGALNREPGMQQRYYDYLNRYARLNTTSHAIGEVCHVIGRALGNYERTRFWEVGVDFLQGKMLEEHLITLLAVYAEPWARKPAPRIGVADTGLAVLAWKLGVDLLTEDDRTLRQVAVGANVSCVVVSDMVRKAL